MKRPSPLLAGILALLGLQAAWATRASAHRPSDEVAATPAAATSRTGTRAADGSHWHGTFEAARDGTAAFRRDDGAVRALPVERLIAGDREWIARRAGEIAELNRSPTPLLLAQRVADGEGAAESAEGPAIHRHFLPFQERLGLRWDENFYYVESTGMPDHSMMVGITAWQQQVPLPQNYRGPNAWRIPLHPVPALEPMSAKTNFFRGAIALAINGVPIFNPIKNDGRTDTFLAGELDQWGGHCGRGDDYHYHIAPVHLEKVAGAGQPIGYALDGYPLYGRQDAKSPDFAPLDRFNGHHDASGNYHYHATENYPYLNGGFHGEVTQRGGQVDPQPRAFSPRPALPPLRGARITGFERGEDGASYRVAYDLRGERRSVEYAIDEGRSVRFTFRDGSAGTRSETFALQGEGARRDPRRSPRERPGRDGAEGRGGGRPPADGRPPRAGGGPPPGGSQRPTDSRAARRPWIEVHAVEMDTDGDGELTEAEVRAEAAQVFAGYDRDRDGRVSLEDLAVGRPVRSAMGGFLREHRGELDRDGDGALSQQEAEQNALRMFARADADADGRLPLKKSDPPGDSAPRPDADGPRASKQTVSPPASTAAGARPPNVVLILADDLGWRDVGFAGNRFVETPHIDRLASEGLQCTQAYASAPNCAPTRACLLSGQYAPRHGVYTVVDPRHDPGQPHHRIVSSRSEQALRGDVVTIAELLRDRGYATACFGMWNLGRGRGGPTTPTGQGFDRYRKPQDLGFEQHAYLAHDGRYLTDVLFDEGLRFIEDAGTKPFFLYLPTHAVHAPFEPKSELLAKYRDKARREGENVDDAPYAATIEALDRNVGRLRTLLAERGLDDRTMIVFTSDNGGTPQHAAPLNGSKGALYEGGLRVPCVVWWRGMFRPGRSTAEPVLSMDFYPTLAELAGAELPARQPIDGRSLTPLLLGTGGLDRDAVYWHFPCYVGRGKPSSAIRAGDWKLIQHFESQSVELFHLGEDPGETRDLAAILPDRTRELARQLADWHTALNAPCPAEANPAFDPRVGRSGGKAGGGPAPRSRPRGA